jgi:CheY-like chemotaxis protein
MAFALPLSRMSVATRINLALDGDMPSVLLVDDDADGREVIAQYLTRAGYRVQPAPNGRSALMSLVADVPDVVILDLMMPEMNGVEFLRVIRNYLRWATLPVIVVTAYPTSPQLEEARKLGVRNVFTKSDFKLPDLLAAVNAIRDNPHTNGAAG